jgi:hypothetical protein
VERDVCKTQIHYRHRPVDQESRWCDFRLLLTITLSSFSLFGSVWYRQGDVNEASGGNGSSDLVDFLSAVLFQVFVNVFQLFVELHTMMYWWLVIGDR